MYENLFFASNWFVENIETASSHFSDTRWGFLSPVHFHIRGQNTKFLEIPDIGLLHEQNTTFPEYLVFYDEDFNTPEYADQGRDWAQKYNYTEIKGMGMGRTRYRGRRSRCVMSIWEKNEKRLS